MDQYLVVDRELLSILEGDCYAAVVYAELYAKRQQLVDEGKLTAKDDFIYQIQDFEMTTNINDHLQRKALIKLSKLGLVKTYLKGAPPHRCIKFINSGTTRN